ncbi:MAG TPA: PPOX class F420-dependent oxidoreductase [Rhodopila sp.]|uniref:PPOX class F420-dependent oxidoreductase n=1 Tax=Rhodopila sp. TaxID=2480087 RepID=UPI002C004771|nr:PPOX class F420-dependent oxidoreductase [Rhodopila sp.]HVY18062.1 PPOX class F420-dependent oxidoreductase [Rhodopila sp.]
MSGWGASFDGKQYLNLETVRRSGQAVRTPVWFAAAPDGTLYVYTIARTGKVKRIRHTPLARIAPCDFRGNVTGPWFDATATLVTGPDFDFGMGLIDRKYRPLKWLLDLGFLVTRRSRVVIRLSPR